MASDLDVSQLSAHMEIGKPMTFEEMQDERRRDDTSISTASSNAAERNPFVFEDRPVNQNNFAVISVVDSSLSQRHESGTTLVKLRGAFPTIEALKAANVPNENCDLFACEMYKFSILPCTADVTSLSEDERDGLMNDCLQMYERMRLASADDFDERKRRMMEDIKRQEDIKERVRAGELPVDAIESASVCPEQMEEQLQESAGPVMSSDTPLNDFMFATVAMISVAEITDADPQQQRYKVPEVMKNKTIFKIAGTFYSEKDAHSHTERLRKQRRYKHIDLYVVSMYEWLYCPPNVEVLPRVSYAHDKLTEAIGTLRPETTASDILGEMMESNIDGQMV